MKPRRRALFLSFSVLFLLLGGGLLFLLLMADDGQELGSAFFGLAIMLASLGLLGVVRCLNSRRPEDLAAVNDVGATVRLTLSRFDLCANVLAMSFVAVGFCVWVFDGYFIVIRIFGGAGLILCLRGLLALLKGKHPPVLQFSPQGLDYSGLEVGTIEWRDIRGAQAGLFLGRAPMVYLELQDEQKYVLRRPKARRPAFGFIFTSPVLELSPEMIVEAVDIRRKAFQHAGQCPA